MKTLMLLAALCLVLCVVLPQTHAACYNYRATSCGLAYVRGCGWYRVCVAYYNTVCYSGKRDIENDQDASTKRGPGKPILEKFPCKFSDYDKDGDKCITFEEFRATLSDVKDVDLLLKIFRLIDKNGDNCITCDEFLKAELAYSHKPVC